MKTRAFMCAIALLVIGRALSADTVKLKDGTVLTGTVDKDGSLVQVFDDEGLRRVVFRDSKIEVITADAPARPERFRLVQPLEIHGGEMPAFAINVEAEPWDKLGRRRFRYVGSRGGKPTEMTQAINDLGPYAVKYRGIDGFWLGSLETRTVPKAVILGLLARVDQTIENERIRVAQFMIQAQWFAEAKLELDRLEKDFPNLKENVATARTLLIEAETKQLLEEIDLRGAAGQPREVERRLKSFPEEGVAAIVSTDVRNRIRIQQARSAEYRDLAQSIRKAADALSEDDRKAFEPRLVEVLKALEEAPDAVRARLEPFRTAPAELDEAGRLALLGSAWVAGPDRATASPAAADTLWNARELVRTYLQSGADRDGLRKDLIAQMQGLEVASKESGQTSPLDLGTLTAITRLMAPPLHDDRASVAGAVRTIRIHDDPNPQQPSEYAVWLPPEYHPLRSYPAFVVLHGKESPSESLAPWIEAAARRGYVLIAPEWATPGKPAAYRYTPTEHAAALLALRDAMRRFAIDADRVFVTGMLEGGNMAWDFGLAHPDMLAGAAVISGLPGKFAWPNKANIELTALYIALGDKAAPTEDPIIFEQWAKPLIMRNHDVRYVKMYRRGLEAFPEEIPTIMQWASARVRTPALKQWEAVTGRESDDRFFGIVARAFSPKRTTAPEAADPMGRNINPAQIKFRANAVLNKVILETSGLTAIDVWFSPDLFDFTKRLEIQWNNKSVFKADADPSDFGPFLEDLRIRGDRKQTYWLKVPLALSGSRRP